MAKLMTLKQLEYKKKKLDGLVKEYSKLGKKISEEAGKSGSFANKIPGYAELTDKMGIISLQIAQLEKEVAAAKIVDPKKVKVGSVSVLSRVTVRDISKNKKEKYCFEGEAAGAVVISQDSSVGKALLGRKIGERVKVKTPRGMRELEILKIEIPK